MTREDIINKKIELLTDLDRYFFKSYRDLITYENDIDVFLFMEPNPENLEFLKNVLKILNKHFTSQEEMDIVTKKLYKSLSNNQMNMTPFIKLLEHFIASGYIVFENGEIVKKIPRLNLNDSLSQWEKILSKARVKKYDCFITNDGEIYLALWEHEFLCNWLCLNNIDCRSAIRVHQSQDDKNQFDISSLAPYKYCKGTEEFKTMYLTNEQAKSLYEMYEKLRNGKVTLNRQSFEDIICDCSENLGTNVNDIHTNLRFNLMTFEEVIGRDKFSFLQNFKRVKTKLDEYKNKLQSLSS